MVLPVLLAVSVLVAIVRDATRVARQQKDNYQLRSYNRWYVYVILAPLGMFLLQPFAIDLIKQVITAFKLPSNSMAPTLVSGDHILIDASASWNGKTVQRGDIIVFLFPEDETKKFVKRVIGLPGETIHIRNKLVYVNEVAIDDSAYAQRIDPGILDAQTNPRDNFGPVTIPEESYFVLGDNRDQSLDSRFFGHVRRSKIMGKVLLIYWSWDDATNSIRWDRVGQHSW